MLDLIIDSRLVSLDNTIVGMHDPPDNIWIAGMVLGNITEQAWKGLLPALYKSCCYWDISYYQGSIAVRFPRNKLDIDVIHKVFPEAIASKAAKAFLLPEKARSRLEYLTGVAV